jgi:hypothetical protein
METLGAECKCPTGVMTSNGNASEAKANEDFDNSIFFASEAKRTCSLEGNLLAKRSEHVRKKQNNYLSEAITFTSKKNY